MIFLVVCGCYFIFHGILFYYPEMPSFSTCLFQFYLGAKAFISVSILLYEIAYPKLVHLLVYVFL